MEIEDLSRFMFLFPSQALLGNPLDDNLWTGVHLHSLRRRLQLRSPSASVVRLHSSRNLFYRWVVGYEGNWNMLLTQRAFVDVVCLLDIVVNFRSSYQDSETKEIVLESRRIAVHYLRGYFWIDLLSSFPEYILSALVRLHTPHELSKATCRCHGHSIKSLSSSRDLFDRLQFHDSQTDLIKFDLRHCMDDSISLKCSADLLVILSLLKYLQLPLFIKYLVSYLHQQDRSSFFIRTVRVGDILINELFEF